MVTRQSQILLTHIPQLPLQRHDRVSSKRQDQLYAALARLEGSTLPSTEIMLKFLDDISSSHSNFHEASEEDADEQLLASAVLMKIAINTYSSTLDQVLHEALEAETEAEWWGRVERSSWGAAYFLLQTFPTRIIHLWREIVRVSRTENVQLSFQNLNRDTFNRLISPHLNVFSSLFPTLTTHPHLIHSPLTLTRQECKSHRKNLEKIRDKRAEELGSLTFLGAQLKEELQERVGGSSDQAAAAARVISQLSMTLGENIAASSSSSLPDQIRQFINDHLSNHVHAHDNSMLMNKRPHAWTLAWPRLVLVPPLLLFGFRYTYNNRDSIASNAKDAVETVRLFWTQWILEPVRDILNTVRTGGDDGTRVISKDGLKSDMESLERMVISLASENQSWSDAQSQELARQIREGDLTPVLKIYEDDIKKPIRSAVSGTLIRSLLIQVQKAKVDIDFALAGIDKLLKSQELTFGFVGVAPSLAILYLFGGWLRGFWVGRKGRGRYGGRRGRESSFWAMRRVERLLSEAGSKFASREQRLSTSATAGVSSDATAQSIEKWKIPLDPRTQGLLIVSLTHLRRYAESELPKHSRLREGFLEDLADLEDPNLGREDKIRVVERMWRSWAVPLEWGQSM